MFWRSKRFTPALTRRASLRPSRLTARLRVEGLEDRTVPAFGASLFTLSPPINLIGPSQPHNTPRAITAGPDGTLWFTDASQTVIGKVTPAGTITQYDYSAAGINGFSPYGITVGPDGNVWFTLGYGGSPTEPTKIVQFTPAGAFTVFPLATNAAPDGITKGPDGNLWFTESGIDKIGRITPSGTITEFTLPNPGTGQNARAPSWITAGPDGNLWFGEIQAAKIGQITPAGVITEFDMPNPQTDAENLIAGPDGNVWFSEGGQIVNAPPGVIGKITPTGTVTEYPGVSGPLAVTPDGTIWAAPSGGLDTIATNGTITPYFSGDPNLGLEVTAMTANPDGSLLLTNDLSEFSVNDPAQQGSHVLRIMPNGPPWTGQGTTISASAGVPFFGVVGTFSGGSDLLPAGQRWVATVNWGDGTTSPAPGPTVNDADSGIVDYVNGQFVISAQHTYTTTGNFTVSVTIASQAAGSGGLNNGGGSGEPPQSPAVSQATVQLSNEAFVGRLYVELLHRGDNDVEMKTYADPLDAGTISRDDVIRDFENSPEYRTLVVQGLYQDLLKRNGGPDEVAFWVAFLANHTFEQAQASFIASPEYYAIRANGTAQGFLTAEYQDVLGRPVDPTALATQVPLLEQGSLSRTDEALRVLTSPEAERRLFATGYTNLLLRPASDQEINGWLSLRSGGEGQEQVIVDLAGSVEFITEGLPPSNGVEGDSN